MRVKKVIITGVQNNWINIWAFGAKTEFVHPAHGLSAKTIRVHE